MLLRAMPGVVATGLALEPGAETDVVSTSIKPPEAALARPPT